MVVIDTHLARGASNGGFTFPTAAGPYGRTNGAERVVAVDVTGLPVGALVMPASTHGNRASDLMLEHLILSREDRPHRITWLAVAPEARGRGLGGALVHAALDRWSTGDIEVITFAADTPGGASARRLYTRLGFDLVGPAEPAGDGGSRDRYVMRR